MMFRSKKYLHYLSIIQDNDIQDDMTDAMYFLRDNRDLLVPLLRKGRLLPGDLHWALIYIPNCLGFFTKSILQIKSELPTKYHNTIDNFHRYMTTTTEIDLGELND